MIIFKDAPAPPSSVGVIFRIDHQSTVLGGTSYPCVYGASLGSSLDMGVNPDNNMGVKNGTNVWNWSHQTAGGYSSRNYLRYDRWEDINGDPNTGFTFSPTTVAPSGGWVAKAQSSVLYLRFRVRWNNTLTLGANSSAQMKWFIFGGPGISGERRMILSWYRASDESYGAGGTDATQVTLTCTAGVSGNHAEVLIDEDVWTHIQVSWRYTDVGSPYIRIYRNNNTEGSPTAEETAFTADAMGGVWNAPEGWTGGGWGDIVSTNSYTGTDAQLDIMDFEVGDTFNASWAP